MPTIEDLKELVEGSGKMKPGWDKDYKKAFTEIANNLMDQHSALSGLVTLAEREADKDLKPFIKKAEKHLQHMMAFDADQWGKVFNW